MARDAGERLLSTDALELSEERLNTKIISGANRNMQTRNNMLTITY